MNELSDQLPLETPTDNVQESLPAADSGNVMETLQSSPMEHLSFAEREQEIHRLAVQAFERSKDWVAFFRVVLGSGGVVQRFFRTEEELGEFRRGEVYPKLQQMLASLRESSKHPNENGEPTRVITVRLPASLHEALRDEAHERKTSMNQLCISKLVQLIDNDLVPTD